ncbi:hypothetical protein JCM11641_003310 [Rhodosporidiobolus odoratus]
MVSPNVLWAQRSSESDPARNLIFLTIDAPELDPSYTFEVSGNKLTFKGKTHELDSPKGTAAHLDAKSYELDIELFDEAEEQKRALSGKSLKVVLQKKTPKEEYWPRLTKEKVRLNWLKTDFALWRDEDEQDDEPETAADDFGGGGMPPMGAGGMGGMPGMGGMGGMGGAGGMDFASMMGGMGGAGGAGGMDFEKMMEQMKASGLGGAGGDMPDFDQDEADNGQEGFAADSDDDDGPPPLEEA